MFIKKKIKYLYFGARCELGVNENVHCHELKVSL